MTAIPLGQGGEFDRIRAIAAALGDAAGPLGDDTAPVPAGDGTLVVSTDTSVEDVHFRRAWLSLTEIGWRATSAALSDLAAAAAMPSAVTAAIIVPLGIEERELVELMRGVGNAARAVGASVIGGDLTRGPSLALTLTVLGHAERPMSRAGAKLGHELWVTGTLGGARAALDAWLAGETPGDEARRAFAHPQPRIETARWLAHHGATAMMDLSDGLGGDAEHLAAASGVGLRIELERLPLHFDVPAGAKRAGEDPAVYAASGGEDYELLVTLPKGFAGAKQCLEETGVPITRIGSLRRDSGVVATLMGAVVPLAGYRHPL